MQLMTSRIFMRAASLLKPTPRHFTNTTKTNMILKASYSSKFSPITTPSPPKLPQEDQEEFERLQKIAASQAAIEEYNASVAATEGEEAASAAAEADAVASAPNLTEKTDIGNFPSYFATIPEFEGDVNPKTGEVGGPKQDPLRHGDYSFNGRVTDF